MKNAQNRLFVIAPVCLEEGGSNQSTIEVLRVGTLHDRGLNISQGMIEDFARHYSENVYGTEIQVNFKHERGGEAAGWFKNLFVSGDKLMALIEWTELGAEKLRKKIFKFISSELAFDYPHHATGEPVSNVFIGAGLTNTPALKGQQPITLAELEEGSQILIHNKAMLKKLIESLKARAKLSVDDIKLAKTMLEDVPAGEEREQGLKDIADLEAKQKKQMEDDAAKEEEEKKKKAGDAGKMSDQAHNTAVLAEIQSLKEDNAKLRAQVELRELNEDITKNMTLSETNSTGFLAEAVSDVAKFMLSLTEAQRKEFKGLIAKVKHADLSVKGADAAQAGRVEHVALSDDKETRVVQLTEQYLKEAKENGKSLSVLEAQNRALAEVNKK